jgi:hypothetical protein
MFIGIAGGGAADVRVSPQAQHGAEFERVDEANGDEQASGDKRCEAVGGVAVVITASAQAEFHVFAESDIKLSGA